MKLNGWTGKLIVLALGFNLMWVMTGCGVKAPPVPPKAFPPAAITDLTYTVDKDVVMLNWSIPTGKAAGTTGLGGFIVHRAMASSADPVCDGCPALFRRVAEIDFEELIAGHPDLETVSSQHVIEKGYQNIFKVTAVSKDGQLGPDSNWVVVR